MNEEITDNNINEILNIWIDSYIELKDRSEKIISIYKDKIKKVRKYQLELDKSFMSVKKEIVKTNRNLLEDEDIKKKLKKIRGGKYGKENI